MAYLMQTIFVAADNPAIQGPSTLISPENFDVNKHRIYEPNYDELSLPQIYLNLIQNFNVLNIPQTETLGQSQDFSPAVVIVETIIKFSNLFVVADMNIFSTNQLLIIKDESYNILQIFSKICNFKINTSDLGLRERIIDELRYAKNKFIDNLSSILSYSVSFVIKTDLYNEKFSEFFLNFKKYADVAKENQELLTANLKEKMVENTDLGNSLKELIGYVQVDTESNIFAYLAFNYEKSAGKWLKYSYGFGIIILLIAILFMIFYKCEYFMPENSMEAAQFFTSKFLLLSIFAYGLVISIRNYSAQMHNSVVNRHREHALKSFRAFVQAAPNPQIGGSILAEAAAAVFTPQDTGYVKNEEAAGSRSFIEMISKAVSGSRSLG